MSKRAASSERRAGMFAQLLILVLSCSLLAARCSLAPRRAMFDLKITNGRIIDGTGAPWYRGDVGVRGDTVVAIGDLSRMTAAETLDARDQIVAPGFIDLLGQDEGVVLEDPSLEAKVRQG